MGIVLVLLFILFFDKTRKGFEIKISGYNPEFARYSGVSVNRVRISVMLLSGAIAGLAGASEIMGVQGRFLSGFSPDFGTSGMLVALLGNSSGIGIFISALFMGMLKAGSLTLERSADVSRALATIIQALIICFISVKTLDIPVNFQKGILQRKGGAKYDFSKYYITDSSSYHANFIMRPGGSVQRTFWNRKYHI